MYKCDICGREIKKKNKIKGFTVCSKHMHQIFKYGHALDNIQRTNNDLNQIKIEDNIATVEVYNQKNIPVAEFIIDANDIPLIKYYKWRIDTNNRIITGNCTKTRPRKEISRLLLNVTDPDLVVDHINGNTLDNRRCNLRICTQAENVCNKSYMSKNTSEYIGVSWDKTRKKWAAEIRKKNYTRIHLSRWDSKEEAVYARYIAECILFGEYRNTNNDLKKLELFKKLTIEKKNTIKEYVETKIASKSK